MRAADALHASPLRCACTYAAIASAGILLLAGCGGSSHKTVSAAKAKAKPTVSPPPVCRPQGAVAVAGTLGISQASVSTRRAVGNNSFPECHFATSAGGRRVSVVVNVDNSPQPYFRLERTIVEDGQQFGVQRNFSPPQTVSHLGLDASWIPDLHQLITTDGVDLLTVTVGWNGVKAARQVALAKAAAQVYLGKPRPKAAKGYASG